MKNLINSLEENLKDLYRKAIDADDKINHLKKQGHGKFEAIFNKEQGFKTSANKFMPYLEEVAENILKIKESGQPAEQQQADIEKVVKQLHLLHSTIANFSEAVK